MECVVVGAGTPFVSEIIAILHRLSWPIVGYVEGGDEGVEYPAGVEPISGDAIPPSWLSLAAVIPILSPWQCREVVVMARGLGFYKFPAVVDPTAIVPHDGTLGAGCVVNAGVVIGAQTALGDFTTINRAASVGHDGQIGSYCAVGPGVTACGSVTIGEGSIVGAGSLILPRTTIGAGAFVGAGSLVSKDVSERTLAIGRPARAVRMDLTEKDVSL